ncbi:MAG: non-ribosomal peptide synthetase, partial [Phycisphaerales bacterium]
MPLLQGPRTVLDLFDAACARHGDGVALDVPPGDGRGRVTWTYNQLSERADRFRAAVAPHAARDAVVVLAMARTDPRLYAAMLGAMRAGCAYCAIDPSFPDRQAAGVVRDARAGAIVGPAGRVRAIADAGGVATWIDPDAVCAIERSEEVRIDTGADHHGDADATPIAPDSLAYVIYTSGTTGKPKGVEIEHRSLLNLVAGDVEAFGLGARDRVAQGSSASYDSSVEEMWLAWSAGACVVVMDDATARLGPDLVDWLRDERITMLCPPPTLLRTLGLDDPARALPDLRLVYVGGEALPEDVAERWSRGMRLENGYGPTECTVTCLRCTVHVGEPVTIGRPIPGTRAWVVDHDRADLPEVATGVHGELVIGGASLARGYRGQPEVTAARFVEHPSFGRVYRTGDLVHRDATGAFHYHGRIDAQVKRRGHRVELGAVEAKLAAQPGVLEAACAVQGIGAGQRLEAYVVMRTGMALDAAALRGALAAELPPALVPAAIAMIDAIPRTVGGKVDRRRLPAIVDPRGAKVSGTWPMTDTERTVVQAIADVLGVPGAVHPDADFFDDLGLDSLTVAMVVSRLRADPRTRAANVRMTYAHRTVRAAAAAIEGATEPGTIETVRERTDAVGHPMPAAVTCAQATVLALL